MAAHQQQSGGQKTFRLARLFHTEDCYRARALTAEELVRRTFIGVDAETFKKLHRQRSYFDASSCESWHRQFDERFQDVPTCRDIATAAERLGFFVERFQLKDRDHFSFGGVRLLSDYGYFVWARCDGCECGCDHDADLLGAGCESCDCACDGCYCAAGCAASHPDVVDDSEDPLMNLTATDANRSHRSRRFALKTSPIALRRRGTVRMSHTGDCKFQRSFTADELVKLTIKLRREGGIGSGFTSYSDWVSRFQYHFEDLPTYEELADVLMRQGIRVGAPSFNEFDGLDIGTFDAFRLTRSYEGCGNQLCECLCNLCGPSGCAKCDCQCEGCFCAGTCADGHPVNQRATDASMSLAWRELAKDRAKKRYERKYGTSWHSQNCTSARWLTADQIVWLTLKQPEVENGVVVGGSCEATRPGPLRSECGFDWVNEWTMDLDMGPSCVEVADAARRAGIPVVTLPKRWPWGRTHYGLRSRRIDANSRFVVTKPSCTSCECFCALCDDCSECSCDCAGCMCAARCLTGDCAVMHELSTRMPRAFSEVERRLGTKEDMSPHDLGVSNALVRLEDEVGIARRSGVVESSDDPPTFELQTVGYWHQRECEHPRLTTLTAEELVYVTLRPISDEILRSHERYGVSPSHTDCAEWSHVYGGLLAPEPTCEQLATAAKRLGYQVKPVEGFRRRWSYEHMMEGWKYAIEGWKAHVSEERQVHYEFTNADVDGRIVGRDYTGRVIDGYFRGFGRLDVERCYGSCECGCKHWDNLDFDLPCECVGCYCRRTCILAGVEE